MYSKVAEAIIQDILNDKYVDKLPTEKELSDKYKVSRNTVRRALDVIFSHGMLRRVQGSGYYVIKRPLQSKNILNLSLVFEKNPVDSKDALKSRLVAFDTVKADEELAVRGNISVGSEVYRVVRLRYLRDQLYDLEEAYYPRSVVPYLTKENAQGSIFNFLRDTYQIVGETSENYVHIELVDEYYAGLLETNKDDKILCLDAINYLSSGTVFNFSRTFFVDNDLALYYHTKNIKLKK